MLLHCKSEKSTYDVRLLTFFRCFVFNFNCRPEQPGLHRCTFYIYAMICGTPCALDVSTIHSVSNLPLNDTSIDDKSN